MKKIDCFIASMSSGGAEHQLAVLTSFLAEKGYIVSIVTFGDCPDHYHIDEKVRRIRLAQKKGKIQKLLSSLIYFFKTEADCVIGFGSRVNTIMLIPLLFRRGITALAGERCATWKALEWYKKLNYKWLYRSAKFIVPNSYTQKEEIKARWPYLLSKVRVITNYTDVNEYPMMLLPHRDVLKIGIFSRYSKQKNYLRFAKVVKELKDCSPKPFEIHWYGNKRGDNGILPEFEEFNTIVANDSLADVLYLHDHVKNVVAEYAKYDVLCLPSLTEGFSNALSEYICTGHPVVASDVADNKLMVREGENGFLFNPKDEGEMLAVFLKMMNQSAKQLDEMGKKSRQIANKLFDKDRFVNDYIEIIES